MRRRADAECEGGVAAFGNGRAGGDVHRRQRRVVVVDDREARGARTGGGAERGVRGERAQGHGDGLVRLLDRVAGGAYRQGGGARDGGSAGEGDGGRIIGEVRAAEVAIAHAARPRSWRGQRVIAAEGGGAAKGERHGERLAGGERAAEGDGEFLRAAGLADIAGARA